jgi:hypothetical protein
VTFPHELSRTARSVLIADAITVDANQWSMLLAEGDVDYDLERTLRIQWDEAPGFAAGFRETAHVRLTASGNGNAEVLLFEVPAQGMAVRVPPGKARVDVRFTTGGPPPLSARVWARIDPGRPTTREAIAHPQGIIPPGAVTFNPHTDPNAAFASQLKLQVVNAAGVAAWSLSQSGVAIVGLPAGLFYLDARPKTDITILAGAAAWAWWVIHE